MLKLAGDYDHNLELKVAARRSIPNIQIRQVAWIPPPFNWKKVNTDGSFLSDLGLASCGGIARDYNGNFIIAWSFNLGHCTITAAKLWAIFWGLLISRSLGFSCLMLEIDLNATGMLIEEELVATHVHAAIINSIRNLLTEDWTVEVNHVYREANNCADKLAKLGHKCPI